MAYTSADLDALDAAIAGGELSVQVDGRRIQYRSIAELLQARAHVSAVLQTTASAGTGRTRFRFNFTTSRGA
jgi:hypothetical protein